MKKFRNVNTGIVETVTNEELIKQYEKHSDVYEEVKETKAKAETKKATKNETEDAE